MSYSVSNLVKRHCPHTPMCALRWHGCWRIHAPEGSVEFRVHFRVPMSVSDDNKHGDGGGDHDNAPSQKGMH